MGGLADYKPEMAMIGLQFCLASLALIARAALLQGMSPRVFIVYRQAIATLVIAPLAYITRRKSSGTCCLPLKSFSLICLASLIGVTINQNMYFEGLYLASSSMASAMGNLVPAITFLMAATVRLEKINVRCLRSLAKIVGTLVCIGGAISMVLLRGPKILNTSIFDGENWLQGCMFLFGSACCWSFWLILQVPVTESYPDHLSLSAWMCFLATIQSAIVTMFLERDISAWKLHSYLELACCLFAGIIGSGVSFFIQAWCISQRGPLFSAMFNPLCTVIVTVLAALFLHEEIYTGSLLGAVGVIIGLYIVLWGKAKDFRKNNEEEEETDPKMGIDQMETTNLLKDETSCEADLEEPLLSDEPYNNYYIS